MTEQEAKHKVLAVYPEATVDFDFWDKISASVIVVLGASGCYNARQAEEAAWINAAAALPEPKQEEPVACAKCGWIFGRGESMECPRCEPKQEEPKPVVLRPQWGSKTAREYLEDIDAYVDHLEREIARLKLKCGELK